VMSTVRSMNIEFATQKPTKSWTGSPGAVTVKSLQLDGNVTLANLATGTCKKIIHKDVAVSENT